MTAPSAERVVGIGLATVDVLCVAPRSHESMIELSQLSLQGGGAVGNALATVSQLGAKASYLGRLSDDCIGRMSLDSLKDYGVDVSTVLLESGKVSPMSIIHIDEQTRRRTVYFTRGNVTALAPRDIGDGVLDNARLLLLDGTAPSAQIVAAERARDQGIAIVLASTCLTPGLGELIALADVLIASERLTAEIAPSGEIEDSLVEISKMGPRVVVLLMGAAGAIGRDGKKLVRQKAIPVDLVDGTGAGDVFHGAFAYALLQGWNLDRSMPFANAAAGLACRSLGSRPGIPRLGEVLEAAGLGA